MAVTDALTHDEWQQQCIDLALVHGWKFLHVRKTVRGRKGTSWVTATNIKGWPDLFLWHERDQRFAAIECKVGRDTAKPEQLDVLAQLAASGASTMVAYPADFDALASMLARRRIAR